MEWAHIIAISISPKVCGSAASARGGMGEWHMETGWCGGLPTHAGYDVNKDFAPVGLIASTPIVVMAHRSLPVKSLADVIALAKKEPGSSRRARRLRRPSTILPPSYSSR